MHNDLIGWIGGLMFALCALPQALKSYKEGNSRGISWLFLFMWLIGELFTFIYVFNKHLWDFPLLINYALNILFIIIILKYKVFPND